ncbi:hypothetical protein HFU84_04700 [Acidithiobacillus sp. CV18-2]|uniref:Elongation factor-1 alpha n=1 Tax=Igneacidithiobacillus copahuensis TaxID=2724909 RepID=A0AAE2YN16_9PROT|nr:hypothetical protein [Igneacidithiobacillus copahuensis]MBU2754592.1 hypothetical protein [Acidithiobacillus sp. CV18-3]MBU2757246.1 hypothetical protein [Acidithiobacillus sp. BN09-2]MBU2776815.1 hypothetical protein [Acidithiobacillus sp. CV18-2]MBU2796437.1 hypothetical protein [Acidithiobacillus sp. VAN18-2]MBU2799455.1 hypothetical protein [Acidithiobacillus sp. VAN18-4]UTV81035.1 hypothetical protein MQE22_13655 [Acidithiobacillus sp. YTS05]
MRQLPELSIAEKLVHTGFIFLVGLGLLVAEAYVYVTVGGKQGLTVQAVTQHYYGNRSSSTIQSVLPRMMGFAGMPASEQPKMTEAINHWIANGESQQEYVSSVKPLIDGNCLKCHSVAMSKVLHNPPLASYDDVKKVAQVDTGMSINTMLLNGMIHLTMLGVIFWIAGWIFSKARFPAAPKYVLIILPFIAMTVDFAGWFLTHQNPAFVWLVLIGGALSCPIALLEMFLSLIQLWLLKPRLAA